MPGRFRNVILFTGLWLRRLSQKTSPIDGLGYVFETIAMYFSGVFLTILLGKPPNNLVDHMELAEADS